MLSTYRRGLAALVARAVQPRVGLGKGDLALEARKSAAEVDGIEVVVMAIRGRKSLSSH